MTPMLKAGVGIGAHFLGPGQKKGEGGRGRGREREREGEISDISAEV